MSDKTIFRLKIAGFAVYFAGEVFAQDPRRVDALFSWIDAVGNITHALRKSKRSKRKA